jgi:Caspase domain
VILIANSAYTNLQPLSAPPHDVEALSSQLSQLGFATTILQNPSYHDVIEAIETASQGASRGSLLALYYSGHAAMVEGENSLLLTGFRWGRQQEQQPTDPFAGCTAALGSREFRKSLRGI